MLAAGRPTRSLRWKLTSSTTMLPDMGINESETHGFMREAENDDCQIFYTC